HSEQVQAQEHHDERQQQNRKRQHSVQGKLKYKEDDKTDPGISQRAQHRRPGEYLAWKDRGLEKPGVFVHQQRGTAAQFREQAEYNEAEKSRERIARRAALSRGQGQLHGFSKG